MNKLVHYLDNSLLSMIGADEEKEIRELIRDYYEFKELERGKSELELILMLFEGNMSIEDIAGKAGLSTRQIRRKKQGYINFFIKVIYRYFDINNNC